MAAVGRIGTGYGPSPPQTRLSCQTLPGVSLFHTGCSWWHPEPAWPLGMPSRSHPLPLCGDRASSRSQLCRALAKLSLLRRAEIPASQLWVDVKVV